MQLQKLNIRKKFFPRFPHSFQFNCNYLWYLYRKNQIWKSLVNYSVRNRTKLVILVLLVTLRTDSAGCSKSSIMTDGGPLYYELLFPCIIIPVPSNHSGSDLYYYLLLPPGIKAFCPLTPCLCKNREQNSFQKVI